MRIPKTVDKTLTTVYVDLKSRLCRYTQDMWDDARLKTVCEAAVLQIYPPFYIPKMFALSFDENGIAALPDDCADIILVLNTETNESIVGFSVLPSSDGTMHIQCEKDIVEASVYYEGLPQIDADSITVPDYEGFALCAVAIAIEMRLNDRMHYDMATASTGERSVQLGEMIEAAKRARNSYLQYTQSAPSSLWSLMNVDRTTGHTLVGAAPTQEQVLSYQGKPEIKE